MRGERNARRREARRTAQQVQNPNFDTGRVPGIPSLLAGEVGEIAKSLASLAATPSGGGFKGTFWISCRLN